MGVKFDFKMNGVNLNKKDLNDALRQHLKGELASVVQAVEFGADKASKECAHKLLEASKMLVPVGDDDAKASRGNVARMAKYGNFMSEPFMDRAKELAINVVKHATKGEYFQFRKANGRYGKWNYVKYDNRTRKYEHKGGSLKDSGMVRSLRDDANDNHKKIIGYKVSYDTRRTDPRSFVNNFNYAIIQHEDSTLKHKVGKHHFLSVPYSLMESEFREYMTEETKKAIKGRKRGGK